MIYIAIASLLLIIYLLSELSRLRSKAREQEEVIEQLKERQANLDRAIVEIDYDLRTLNFSQTLSYYDFANFLHKSQQSTYRWNMDEEIKLMNLKSHIDHEKYLRGLPIHDNMNRLEGL